MAVRKETIKQQFDAIVPTVLEPGEQVQAAAFCVTGPNPMLSQGLFGLLGWLIFHVRPYYVVATDRRVVFLKSSIWTTRPTGFGFADRRSTVSISDVNTEAKLWNSARYSSPSEPKLRLNFHVFWRDETRQLAGALADRISGTIAARADEPRVPQEIVEKLEAEPQIDYRPPPPPPPPATPPSEG